MEDSDEDDYQSLLQKNHDDYRDPKSVNWIKLGHQLTEIASAFEVSYEVKNKTPQQQEIFQIYRDLKNRSLALNRQDQTLVGLAKTICRQVLLSTIWILLKKIM